MQVILLEKMHKLGDLGDEVTVKSGFGRNFLVPKGKALSANKKNRAIFESRRAELEAAASQLLSDAEKRKEKIMAAGDVNILANAGIEGKLFGSVGASEIAGHLNTAGAEVAIKEVRMPTGVLRHTGEYSVDIKLHADVIVAVKVVITSEAEVQAKAQAEERKEAKTAKIKEMDNVDRPSEEA